MTSNILRYKNQDLPLNLFSNNPVSLENVLDVCSRGKVEATIKNHGVGVGGVLNMYLPTDPNIIGSWLGNELKPASDFKEANVVINWEINKEKQND